MKTSITTSLGSMFRTLLLNTLLFALALAPVAYGAGSFAATGSLNTARTQHTATLLPNGKMLVAGGAILGSFNTATTSCELYDPATGTWTPTGSMSAPRVLHTATLLPNGKVLVAGGGQAYPAVASCELYDPATGSWTPTGSLNASRVWHKAVLLPNGNVLVAAGTPNAAGGTELSSAELYGPATGNWTLTGNLNTARTSPEATLLPNGKVLIAAGWSYAVGGPINSAELYDPATGSWTPTGNLVGQRFRHALTLLSNGKVLVMGGWNNSSLASAELYDPATGTWSATGSLSAGREELSATLLPNGKVLAAGGRNANGGLASAQLFNPATGTWASVGNLTATRSSHTATLLPNGKVLIVGGQSPTTSWASTELYSDTEILPFSLNPATITAPARLPDGTFQFSYTNVSGLPFTAVGATNLSTPATNWSFVAVGIETAPDQYRFTDSAATNYPHRFYRVKLP